MSALIGTSIATVRWLSIQLSVKLVTRTLPNADGGVPPALRTTSKRTEVCAYKKHWQLFVQTLTTRNSLTKNSSNGWQTLSTTIFLNEFWLLSKLRAFLVQLAGGKFIDGHNVEPIQSKHGRSQREFAVDFLAGIASADISQDHKGVSKRKIEPGRNVMEDQTSEYIRTKSRSADIRR